jgi:predicted peptidase
LGFWEYLPPDYGDGPVPLLVFTHGTSWQGPGTEDSLQELLDVGPPKLLHEDQWPDSRPFVVLSPQNPRSGCFDANDIRDFYDYALATYDIDRARIYHTGQSCGAIGAWNYLAAHGNEHVVAAVLISGDGRDAFASAGCALGRVAIWGLHNENDGSVSSAGTIEPLESLMNCDPKPEVKLTIYPGETAHDAWTKTYDLSAGNDVYTWLLAHQRP